MRLKYYVIIVLSIGLISCGGNKSDREKISIDSLLDEASKSSSVELSTESMNEIIQSIPSPIEIAMVIKQSGTEFKEDLLNPENNAKHFTTDQEKAFSIGIYGGDLGYINIFEKSFLTVNYLGTIKKQAEAINVGQFFDFNTIKRMATNNDKMDSLIYLSTLNFNRMDNFLRAQKRSNLSILIVTGTWTEGLYIASQVSKQNRSKEITDWIGYQKIILDQLLLGLSAYKNDIYFQNIIAGMNELKSVYDNIQIVYEYHEPESVEVDGRLVIIDKSTSTVNISDEQVETIRELIGKMRNKLTMNS